jgi:iron complex transport system substrate-binding protein
MAVLGRWMLMMICSHRLAHAILLGITIAILISACHTIAETGIAKNTPAENCRTVQHVMGSTCIPRNPQRVVTLDSLENTWALGVRPIASSYYFKGLSMPKYLQGKVNRVESVGDYSSPNIEKILRLRPDLIIVGSELQGIYRQLSYIAPTVVLNRPFPLPSWMDMLGELAYVLNKEEVSKQLINKYWQRVEELKQAMDISAGSPKENRREEIEVSVATISLEYGISAYGEKHFSGLVLKDIGLQRPKSQRGDFFYVENITKETVSDIDGDILFFLLWDNKDDLKVLEKLKQSPLWSHLKVFQRNKIRFVGDHWHQNDVFAINAILDDLERHLVDAL